jgi:hypothetical protein
MHTPPHQPSDDAAPTARTPRETLTGDRLCTHCMQPLAGRTIERDAGTGLLFVRCGECGAASALFEYPTVAPWINRIKAVAASTLAAFFLLAMIALTAVSGGFSGAVAGTAPDEAADVLAETFRETTGVSTQEGWRFGTADETWLASDVGQSALAASRWSVQPWIPSIAFCAVATALSTPFALLLSMSLVRHGPLRRMILVSLPCLLGLAIAISVTSLNAAMMAPGAARTWTIVSGHAHATFFALVAGAWICSWCMTVALAGPSVAAGIARLILPPRDRALVGWLWEWRGKPIPRR